MHTHIHTCEVVILTLAIDDVAVNVLVPTAIGFVARLLLGTEMLLDMMGTAEGIERPADGGRCTLFVPAVSLGG